MLWSEALRDWLHKSHCRQPGWEDGKGAVGWTQGKCLQGDDMRIKLFFSRPPLCQVTLLKGPRCQNSGILFL